MASKQPNSRKPPKTPSKTAPRLVPAKNGGAVYNGGVPGNSGGKPGRSGRRSDAFKQLCRDLASGETTVAELEKILGNSDHPQFMAALRWATENGFGKAKEFVEHSGSLEHEHRGVITWGSVEVPL